MKKLIFLNLCVADLAASAAFYSALGYPRHPGFSDQSCHCVVISAQICLMLVERDRFVDFVRGPLGDPTDGCSATYCISAQSRAEVDWLVATALAHGGSPWKDPVSCGSTYGHSFADPDGHVWETLYVDQNTETTDSPNPNPLAVELTLGGTRSGY